MTRNKKIGTTLIILPPILFIISLIGYAVVSSVLSYQLALGNPNISAFIVLRMILGLCGILGILGVFTAIPAGIYFLIKK